MLLIATCVRALSAEPSLQQGTAAGVLSGSYSGTELAKETPLSTDHWWDWKDRTREQKVIAANAVGVGIVSAIGLSQWNYGSTSFGFRGDGWFGHTTDYGGADKLGHAFAGYALTGVYRRLYKNWGYSDGQALLGGAVSSALVTTMIEVGDGFSKKWGFSCQDEAMDLAGIGMAYLRHRYPAIEKRVDYRLEWVPSATFRDGEHSDLLTDYSGQKYLLAFKLGGFLATDEPFWRVLEVQVGYYTRGYLSASDAARFHGRHRYGYAGIGLNMSYILERLTGHRAAGVFDYVQVPYTYLAAPRR
jgi:hypothetical protein